MRCAKSIDHLYDTTVCVVENNMKINNTEYEKTSYNFNSSMR